MYPTLLQETRVNPRRILYQDWNDQGDKIAIAIQGYLFSKRGVLSSFLPGRGAVLQLWYSWVSSIIGLNLIIAPIALGAERRKEQSAMATSHLSSFQIKIVSWRDLR